MKRALTLITMLSALASGSALSEEKTVAFKVVNRQPAGYLTFAGKAGFNISGTKVDKKQVFTLDDKNGGDLAEGDEVTIKAVKFLQEKEGAITYGSKADATSKFKVKKTDKGISLQTPSGKFIAAKAPNEPVSLADTADTALVFEVVPASAPGGGAAEPAGGEDKE